MDGGWLRLRDAKLYTMAESRPRLIVSAFGPKAAAIAGHHDLDQMADHDPLTSIRRYGEEVLPALRDEQGGGAADQRVARAPEGSRR
jgi:hypothetical protein